MLSQYLKFHFLTATGFYRDHLFAAITFYYDQASWCDQVDAIKFGAIKFGAICDQVDAIKFGASCYQLIYGAIKLMRRSS